MGFTDASYAPKPERSIQSTQVYMGGNLVSWTSARQAYITMSTAEAELTSLTALFTEMEAIAPLVEELNQLHAAKTEPAVRQSGCDPDLHHQR